MVTERTVAAGTKGVTRVDRPRHLYVHVPFCARRCSYCDFAIAVRRSVPVDDYLRAAERELQLRFAGIEGWELDTLYVGGGTPSRLGAEGIARLIGLIRRFTHLADRAEVTIEANPDDMSPTDLAAWRNAGVNRLSVGVQSFHPGALEWMHRIHTAGQAVQAIGAARAAGFDSLSLDLIFALPEALGRDWEADLERALSLDPDHISLYGLTVEPHTPLGRWHARGEVDEAPEERYEDEFLLAHRMLAAAGFEHYEVSNFARPEKRSRHNSAYWSRADYAGIGPSAHEKRGECRRWNAPAYAEWLRLLSEERDPAEGGGTEFLNEQNRLAETVYLGLRTEGGLGLEEGEIALVQPWIESGWGTISPARRLTLSPLGWLRLDGLAADLTLFRSRS